MSKLDNPKDLQSVYSQVIKRQFIKEDLGLGPAVPGTLTVPAPGDLASGGSGRFKGPPASARPTVTGPGSENEENCDDNSFDMIKRQLIAIADKSVDLFEALDNCESLEAWQINKLNLAADYVGNVLDSVKYKGSDQEQVNTLITSEPMGIQSALKLANDVASV